MQFDDRLKKAKMAVARCLAVTVIALLKNPTKEYVSLSDEGKKGFERYHAEMEYLVMQKAAKKERPTPLQHIAVKQAATLQWWQVL